MPSNCGQADRLLVRCAFPSRSVRRLFDQYHRRSTHEAPAEVAHPKDVGSCLYIHCLDWVRVNDLHSGCYPPSEPLNGSCCRPGRPTRRLLRLTAVNYLGVLAPVAPPPGGHDSAELSLQRCCMRGSDLSEFLAIRTPGLRPSVCGELTRQFRGTVDARRRGHAEL